MRENLTGAAPGTVSGPNCIIPPRADENANPRHATHMPDASDAGMP
jgi:hypothetical protein